MFDRDKHSPLHLSAAWGLEKTVQCLMEHNADVNAKVIMICCSIVTDALILLSSPNRSCSCLGSSAGETVCKQDYSKCLGWISGKFLEILGDVV